MHYEQYNGPLFLNAKFNGDRYQKIFYTLFLLQKYNYQLKTVKKYVMIGVVIVKLKKVENITKKVQVPTIFFSLPSSFLNEQ